MSEPASANLLIMSSTRRFERKNIKASCTSVFRGNHLHTEQVSAGMGATLCRRQARWHTKLLPATRPSA